MYVNTVVCLYLHSVSRHLLIYCLYVLHMLSLVHFSFFFLAAPRLFKGHFVIYFVVL